MLTAELGRHIEYARPSETEYLDSLAAAGMPSDYIAVQKMIYRVVRWNISAFPNRTVRKLMGRPDTTFPEFARDVRDVWLP